MVRSREILFYKLCSLKGKQAIQDRGKKKKKERLYNKEMKAALRCP